ncbi:hypothetical protein V4C53_34705 [Paraburkholderia azotifigens]|uniref:hypothetical protein n=1 Tax=Paraburkholderia azotifigens TaxID=2057004 RepID=UPI00316D5A47
MFSHHAAISPNAISRAHLAAFKVHDRNMHDVQQGVAGVSLPRVMLLWHLEIAMKHIATRARRKDGVPGHHIKEKAKCPKPLHRAQKISLSRAACPSSKK